jgi:CPA1 family monovalent cation:H+ antiporter
MSRSVTEVFVGLLIVAIPLIGLARRWLIPYPIALVLAGLALGIVPGLPAISLDGPRALDLSSASFVLAARERADRRDARE